MDFIVTTTHDACETCRHLAISAITEAMFAEQPVVKISGPHQVDIVRDPNGIGRGYHRAMNGHPSRATFATRVPVDKPHDMTINPKRPLISDPEGNIIQFPLERRRLEPLPMPDDDD